MPPKPGFDPDAVHYIFMKVVGGEVAPAAALAPKCSPIGMPPKKVGEDIQKATKDWKGLKVEVEIRIQNKQSTVTVMPTAAPLIIKALKESFDANSGYGAFLKKGQREGELKVWIN